MLSPCSCALLWLSGLLLLLESRQRDRRPSPTFVFVSPRHHNLHTQLTRSIRVTGPHDDEDWLIGESVDGSRAGGFPKVCF